MTQPPDFLASSAERAPYDAVAWLARENEMAADAFREATLRNMRRIV